VTEQEEINRLSAWFLQLDDAGKDIISDLSQKLVVFRRSFAESACISETSDENQLDEEGNRRREPPVEQVNVLLSYL
jgi:hypothetical protein